MSLAERPNTPESKTPGDEQPGSADTAAPSKAASAWSEESRAMKAAKPAAERPAAASAPRRVRGRRWQRYLRRLFALLFIGAAAVAIVFAWLPKPVVVETAVCTRGELVVTVDEDGRTRVKDRYTISAPLSGNAARPDFHAGDPVKQGQLLGRIVPLSAPLLDARSRTQAQARVAASQAAARQAKAQVERARVALDFAKKEAAREAQLVKQDVSTQEALDRVAMSERSREAELTSAEFGVKVANYELEMARAALGRYRGGEQAGSDDQLDVPSPINGRVLRVIQESEGVVQAGSPLVEVGDPSALEVVVDVLTSDAVNIEPGAEVSLERWGGPALKARVRLIEPSAFTRLSALGVEEQRVNAVIDLEEPYEKWSALGDGYRVEARITIWRGNDVLKIPASALFRHEQGWAVFVVDGESASLRPVEIGRRNGLEAQVLSGLNQRERVIIHPSDRIAEGVQVTYR